MSFRNWIISTTQMNQQSTSLILSLIIRCQLYVWCLNGKWHLLLLLLILHRLLLILNLLVLRMNLLIWLSLELYLRILLLNWELLLLLKVLIHLLWILVHHLLLWWIICNLLLLRSHHLSSSIIVRIYLLELKFSKMNKHMLQWRSCHREISKQFLFMHLIQNLKDLTELLNLIFSSIV